MKEKQSFVYILTNKYNTVLYVGVTSNLVKRIWEHKNKLVDGFTKKYNVDKLVYYEVFEDIKKAIKKEKYIKGKKREYKIEIIKEKNQEWRDLYEEIVV